MAHRRFPSLKFAAIALALLPLPLLAACGGNDTSTAVPSAAAPARTSVLGTASAAASAVAGVQGDLRATATAIRGVIDDRVTTVDLKSTAGSDLDGHVLLTDIGSDKTSVTIAIPGKLTDSDSYRAYIGTGSCSSPSMLNALNDIKHGASQSEVSVALSSLRDGSHVVVIAGDSGNPGSCGQIAAK